MLNYLINKLQNDINCELSDYELKILYDADYNNYAYFINMYGLELGCNNYKLVYDLRNKRNKYQDLTRLFGRNHVACNKDEINIDTVCFLGNLDYDEILPTYNLRYIYGELYYHLNKIYNLENLLFILNTAYLDNLDELDGLDSLEYVKGFHIDDISKVAFNIRQLDSNKDTYIGILNARGDIKSTNLKYIVGDLLGSDVAIIRNFVNLEEIYGSASFVDKLEDNCLNKLRLVTDCFSTIFYKEIKTLEYVGYLDIDNIVIDSLVLPKMNRLSCKCSKKISNLVFKGGVKHIQLDDVIQIENTVFPDNVSSLQLFECKICDIVLPPNLDRLTIYDLEQLRGCTVRDSLKIYLNYFLIEKSIIENYATIIHDNKIKKL